MRAFSFLFFSFFISFNFFAFIDVDALKMAHIGELPYRGLGTTPKFGLREEIEFAPVFTSSKQRVERKFTVVYVQVEKKRALDLQNLLFFIYLLVSLSSPPPSPSSLLPGFIHVRKRLGIRARF